MKHLTVGIVVLAATTSLASADPVLAGRVTDSHGAPLGGAIVVVVGPSGQQHVFTGPDGRYSIDVGAAGTYSVVFAFGPARLVEDVALGADDRATRDAVLHPRAEVIEIHDPARPAQKPRPLGNTSVLPPYSDQAILRDVWTRAWLLLDVDDTGAVEHVRFVKRPGADLDSIAVATAFQLRFAPARDRWGHAQRAFVLWPIEWPSYSWLVKRIGVATRMPKYDPLAVYAMSSPLTAFPWDVVNVAAVPCRGSGPLNLDSVRPVYRDCSLPDLEKLPASETWIAKPVAIARR